MSIAYISQEYLTDIADAIRNKLNSQETYYPSEMANAIESIDSGSAESVAEFIENPDYFVNDMVYVVESGDNLSDIADKFGMKWTDLKEYNNLSSDIIYAGEELIIPNMYNNTDIVYDMDKEKVLVRS